MVLSGVCIYKYGYFNCCSSEGSPSNKQPYIGYTTPTRRFSAQSGCSVTGLYHRMCGETSFGTGRARAVKNLLTRHTIHSWPYNIHS